ncbi:MAG: DNA-binding response OmpR family regulator [Salibacteraceae bacterium]|jgi:DNA-binding response OmpR family regulator
MKILIIEDEQSIASFLKKGLEENGHETHLAFDGEIGLRLAASIPFDVILLDIILPKINGLEVCHKLRTELNFDKHIIMLTALGTTDDLVDGLNIGADDYLVKPIKFKELLARLNAINRRVDSSTTNATLKVGDLELNLDSKEVTFNEKEIKLTAKEFYLLAYLMRNKGKVMSRIDILENVWEINFDLGTNVIDVYMNYLRKKIDKEFNIKLLHTVVGMGYVLKEEL